MQVTISQAQSMIVTYIKAGLVPMLVSSPGCGKSDIIHQIAADFNLKVIDLRLSQCDPTDLNGFPKISGNRASYAPMDTFPLEGDPIPEGYVGWLLFLDEFNGADQSVQKAAYKVVLDKMVGMYNLHKKVAIVCAGNLETDNALVEPMSTALQSRLVHLELVLNKDEWIEWATTHDIDVQITSYINFKPGQLHNFDPDHTDKTFACPRTWEFVNRILKHTTPTDPNRIALISGAISEGVAREFLLFCKVYADLPKIQDVIASPDLIAVSEEPSIIYAMCGAIAHNASEDNLSALMRYIVRIPKEFQVICMKELIRRNKALTRHPAAVAWTLSTSAEIF